MLGILADESCSYANSHAAMADVEISGNDRILRFLRPFKVSFRRLLAKYANTAFRHYLASNAALEDA